MVAEEYRELKPLVSISNARGEPFSKNNSHSLMKVMKHSSYTAIVAGAYRELKSLVSISNASGKPFPKNNMHSLMKVMKHSSHAAIVAGACRELKPFVSISNARGEFITVLDKTFSKAYKPAEVEAGVYESWEEKCSFKNEKGQNKKFSLVLPPPNITGTLHLGHILTVAIQDVLVRWHRMEGRDVMWVPGLDHAGIATQTVVERWLKQKKNISRHDIGRDKFVNAVTSWGHEKANIIHNQLRKTGASLDWSKEMFTMDPRHNDAVVEALVGLWNSGLIYRKESLINWSCELSSAISDIEVDRIEVTEPTPISVPGYEKPVIFGELTEFAYKVCGSDEEVCVATTRPETMLGDVAVAVHPEDNRFTHLHNSKLLHPFQKSAIPIICDTMVDMKFGTGAVKITPGHSYIDWDVAQRHKLPLLSVIDESGCITTESIFKGMRRFDARDAIRKELNNLGLLRSVRPHSMQVPICSRSGDVVEYLLKHQWFVSCKTMAEKASLALRNGQLQIEPTNYHNIWFNWLDNIRDWCISRQLWWGHRLPMYHASKGNTSTWVVARSKDEAVIKATSVLGAEPESVTQDPDVLDTWFSSALYPLSSLGWPKQTDDLQRYFPLDVMETGHDILFFWVARMVMLSEELTGELPFKKILLHGIICDAHGRKMSKSLGNVINPEDVVKGISLEGLKQKVIQSHEAGLLSASEMDLAIKGQEKLFPNGIPECGTDALRFTLLSHNTKNHFISFDVRECETNHHFCNKVWQATRFTLGYVERLKVTNYGEPQLPGLMDCWILKQLCVAVDAVTSAFQSADFNLATAAIKNFLYNKFCDIYVETAKPILQGNTDKAVSTCQTLLFCLDVSLRLTSPIMPFISEQLYKHLPGNADKSAMLAKFPSVAELQKWKDFNLDSTVELGLNVSSTIRSMKNVNGFTRKQIIPVEIDTSEGDAIRTMKSIIELISNCNVTITEKTTKTRSQTLTNTLGNHTLIHISLKNMDEKSYSDYVKLLQRKELKIQKTLNRLIEKTSAKHYERRVDKDTQLRNSETIRSLEDELRTLQSLMNCNN